MTQLQLLSSDDSYKLPIGFILETISERNFNDFGQNGYRIFQLTSQILLSLMTTNSNVIKQNVLELLLAFRQNDKDNVITDVIRSSPVAKALVVEYLNKDSKEINFNKTYYEALKNNEYDHKCVVWRNISPKRFYKKLKPDDEALRNEEERGMVKLKTIKSKVVQPVTNNLMISQGSNLFDVEVDSVSEAIDTLKGDVKCLMNILKTDKLSSKNVSALKLVTNQLLSLM